jgi:uncharacterized protein YdaU (DUF1376 family)
MPLYIGDYLADTMHLSPIQHGIYMLLIMAYWRNGGPLPNDPAQLAAIARCSPKVWLKQSILVSQKFHVSDSFWAHKRIDAELASAVAKTEERSRSGSEGARQRWQKQDGSAIGLPLANASQNDAPSPSPSESKKEETPLTPQGGRVSASEEFDGWWQECPRKVGKDAAARKYLIARRQADAETLLAGMRRYRASVSDKEPQYIVHPAAWLHQGRWKDEEAVAVNGHDSGPKEPAVITPELKEWMDKWHH